MTVFRFLVSAGGLYDVWRRRGAGQVLVTSSLGRIGRWEEMLNMGPGQGGLPYRLPSLLPCHDISGMADSTLVP